MLPRRAVVFVQSRSFSLFTRNVETTEKRPWLEIPNSWFWQRPHMGPPSRPGNDGFRVFGYRLFGKPRMEVTFAIPHVQPRFFPLIYKIGSSPFLCIALFVSLAILTYGLRHHSLNRYRNARATEIEFKKEENARSISQAVQTSLFGSTDVVPPQVATEERLYWLRENERKLVGTEGPYLHPTSPLNQQKQQNFQSQNDRTPYNPYSTVSVLAAITERNKNQ
eukprot:TRINITY_DN798_c0_g1_i1.p1 TRINITY_DN798_c0_g1~~TRINITY_DN798_c0_g1_i1.p1  ORF type:complete len:222 (-),score=2.15 TRINITY_DN798_c0_g1_i1:286-951(-)